MRRRMGWLLLAGFVMMTVLETGASLVASGIPAPGLPAEAIVGRPLTPVSVAGVTRRTVRRCVATVAVC